VFANIPSGEKRRPTSMKKGEGRYDAYSNWDRKISASGQDASRNPQNGRYCTKCKKKVHRPSKGRKVLDIRMSYLLRICFIQRCGSIAEEGGG